MGLDITISRAKPIYCPHCGELVTYRDVDTVDGGGSSWYEFLESIGYYKPYVKGKQYKHDMYVLYNKKYYLIWNWSGLEWTI